MGVAVRTYFRSPRSTDTYLESYLELWAGDDLLPGYGWIFPLPDGTVNVGLGLLNTSSYFQNVDYKKLLWDWVAGLPPEWGFTKENQIGKIRGGGLPMAFNRTAVARPGLMLIGDAAGAVNPFNGEGIAYAMETAEIAAAVAVEANGDPYALREYPERLKEASELIEKDPKDRPQSALHVAMALPGARILHRITIIPRTRALGFLTKHGMKREWLMRFAFKILANLTEPRNGDAGDRLINALVDLAPAAKVLARS